MLTTKRTLLAGAAALALPALLRGAQAQGAGWAGSPANEQALTGLAEAAGTSQVVVYGAYSVLFRPVFEVFRARFPRITVIGNPVAGAQLMARLDGEFASGQHNADMVMSGTTELLATVDQGRAEPFRPPNAEGYPGRYADPQFRFILNFAEAYGIAYNTAKMQPGDLPQSITDFTNPKYKGMVIDDPMTGLVSTLCWIELFNSGLIDGAWMKGMKANATVVPSTAPFFNNLTAGSVSMIPWAGHSRYLRLKAAGAPVGYVARPGMGVPIFAGTAVVKDAPHMAAAKLLQSWFITPEAQAALVKEGYSFPLLPGVALPSDWIDFQALLGGLKPLPPSDYMAARGALETALRQNFR